MPGLGILARAAAQVGAAEIGATQVGAVQVEFDQVDFAEVGVTQVWGLSAATPPRIPLDGTHSESRFMLLVCHRKHLFRPGPFQTLKSCSGAPRFRRKFLMLTAAVGAAAASKENGDAFYKLAQNKNNQRGAKAQDKWQQK
jgi:hypothetical protein